MSNRTPEQQRAYRKRRPEVFAAADAKYAAKPEVKARRRAQYRAKNPPPIRSELSKAEQQRQWRANNYARCLFHRCKAAAKRKGLPFDLTVEHIEKLLEPMVCPMTGVTLIITAKGDRHPLQPSIDQIRPGEGYVIGNVRVVSWIYNRAKGMDGDEDVKAFALALVRQMAIGNIR